MIALSVEELLVRRSADRAGVEANKDALLATVRQQEAGGEDREGTHR